MPVVIPEQNEMVLNLRHPERVRALIPSCHDFTYRGHALVKVPHTMDVMRVLRNLGINVKGHEVYRYRYRAPLIRGRHRVMAHQTDTAAFLTERTRAFVLHPPRMGKTASILLAIDFLRAQGLVRAALVIAPVSGLHTTWEAEAFGLFPHWSAAVLTGSRERRLKLLAQDYDLYIINPDGIGVIAKELAGAVRSGRIGVVVVDEITDFANPETERWGAAEQVVRLAAYAWGVTGTPGDPMHVYGQVKLIDPKQVPASRTAWRNMTMYQSRNRRKYLPLAGSEKLVSQAMQPAICYEKDKVLGLPPLQTLEFEAPLSREQKKLYEALRRDMLVATDDGNTVTAANAAVLVGKLLQVATGAVKTDTGAALMLDMHERLSVLDTIIGQGEFKTVVFAPYRAAMDALVTHLEKRWTVARVDGDVTGRKRSDIFTRFQSEAAPHVLVLHPRTAAFSVELAAADTIVFFGPPMNGAFVYSQACERINSGLQKSKTPAIVHLHSTPAERRLFRSLREGVDLQERIIELFREIVHETA
ncbi:helicase-related protein [Paraburkholderia dinghuensis]|uniref:DEAD/DEAH box helicase n=1 Tax=Paraburkholderia dinghuensis TaxID=2305225 RepID=A0A3N6MS49_9BURK|nr:helicase-related protein [Paraburkholderia dinghuensis]RQH06608.1 DEAD/DEAH box helicase [Paraburkholderia dinghuensis]